MIMMIGYDWCGIRIMIVVITQNMTMMAITTQPMLIATMITKLTLVTIAM